MAGQAGVVAHHLLRGLPRLGDDVLVVEQAEQPQRAAPAGLVGAEHVALAPLLEVDAREREAVAGLGDGVEALSAGSKPSGLINPKAVRFMAERGVDLSTHASKSLDEVAGEFDAVVTMGCGDDCPWVPARRREDWALPDPKHMDDDGYRAVRDEIEARVRALLAQL